MWKKLRKKKRIIIKAKILPNRTKRKTSKKERGVLKPVISFWLVFLLILELVAGMFLFSPIPPIREANAA